MSVASLRGELDCTLSLILVLSLSINVAAARLHNRLGRASSTVRRRVHLDALDNLGNPGNPLETGTAAASASVNIVIDGNNLESGFGCCVHTHKTTRITGLFKKKVRKVDPVFLTLRIHYRIQQDPCSLDYRSANAGSVEVGA